jgi:hypothetical protein
VDFGGSGRPEFVDGLYFMYPPFVIWVTLPLAPMPRLVSYLACVAAVAGATFLATLGILRTLGAVPLQRFFGTLGTMASVPWNSAVFLGHLSAGLLLAPFLALLAWARGKVGIVGLSLALLLAKPKWGLPVFFFLVCGRRSKMVGGFLAGAALLALISLPLGEGLWGEWIQTMLGYRALIADSTPPWKQATLYATLQSLSQRRGFDPWIVGSWVTLSLPLLHAVARTWLRLGREDSAFPRILGLALLATLATNPYAYLYDAVLLVLPMAVPWTRPDRYRSGTLRRAAMAVSLATWVWMPFQLLILGDQAPSLTGLGLGVWLLLELADLRAFSPKGVWGEGARDLLLPGGLANAAPLPPFMGAHRLA